ncbi:MAG: NAD(P)H-hydrate dehydratase [Chloroflexota bacterium]|nr:NAD(P)H-hydrate dehydratase [Chloroflexota bacterium]
MKIVTIKQIQAIERSADSAGLSYSQMKRNAGEGIANWLAAHLPLRQGVIGLVGSGNNGADTLIALRKLAELGIRAIAFMVKSRGNDPLIDDLVDTGGCCVDISQGDIFDQLSAALVPGVVVLDGILGTGFRLPLRDELSARMGMIYDLIEHRSGTWIIAIDCPSGLDCDTGEVSEVTLHAEQTLCMAAIKQGLLKNPGRSFAGQLNLIDIGISDLNTHTSVNYPEMIDRARVVESLPERQNNGHKGTFGTCFVLAGTKPFTGAAYLTGKAAYRSGCGLVDIGTIDGVHRSLSGQLIEAVWTTLPSLEGAYDPGGVDALRSSVASADALVIGPGWGLHDYQEGFLRQLLPTIPDNLPTLFDADGLKLLSKIDSWWEKLPEKSILTPHPGEMSVLTGLENCVIQENRWEIAQRFAHRWNVLLILKGAISVIALPSGALFINPISDSALATAGSGDVLSGMIGGMLAQGWDISKASIVGTWMHARAGVTARKKLGTSFSVMATDILDEIPDVFAECER